MADEDDMFAESLLADGEEDELEGSHTDEGNEKDEAEW